jgi:hypothetical protein
MSMILMLKMLDRMLETEIQNSIELMKMVGIS